MTSEGPIISQSILPLPRFLGGQSVRLLNCSARLARSTRPDDGAPPEVADRVSWGAGPRASQNLILGAKARAALDGRFAASIEDVRDVAVPVLSHRVVLGFAAAAQGVSPREVIEDLVAAVPAPGAKG